MTKRKKIIFTCAAAVVIFLFVGWLLAPRLLACLIYHRLTAKPVMLERLSVKPSNIEIPYEPNVPAFSLGYAAVPIKSEEIEFITCTDEAIQIKIADTGLVFMPPWSPTSEQETEEDTYGWSIKVANAEPKTYSQIFSMKSDEFKKYIMLAMPKMVISANQRGVIIFNAKYVHGLIRLGSLEKGSRINAEIYSKESNISQSILITSKSVDESKKELLSLLASYRYTVKEIPDGNELHTMIIGELRKHKAFKEGE